MNAAYVIWPVVVLVVLITLALCSGRKTRPVRPVALMTTVEAYWTADGIAVYQNGTLLTILADSCDLHDAARDNRWLVEWGQVPDVVKVQTWYGTSRTAVR